jgi:ABC-type uncharacterized transport system substrate-binding protein
MRFDHLKRREFITLLSGAATAWPVAARAQMPVIGFLSSGSPGAFAHFVAAFRRGLADTGYVEHRNVGVEYVWAEGQNNRLPALADDLVRARVSVICAGGPPAALAAKAGQRRSPSSSPAARTRSRLAWWRVSIGPTATSRALPP